MNQRLVDSLVQVIEALSPEERTLLESRLKLKAVQKKPGVCGGYACLRNTRIPVWVLVSLRQQGANDRELLENYPSLTPEDLIAAWEYYEQHSSEIDLAIVAQNEDD
ncbi:DUF433 domain-containing protein [Anabaena lutea]|uniref:DUF433 domain-containing protein n=1 Tax=Anabaena lutea FACHB-196 TaxID=2692881 RepID=A0ABR8FNK5_9NOST|nr:DUF433 domain-containing protein [Anabaena lutea]MBD2570519.1 DUF433 domain-containing protein [Anabaena lutea FACHB-196]